MKQRILYLDVAKAVAICLVCIGHIPRMLSLGSPSVLFNWIYSFHMPLFMLLSGYFSVHAFEKPFVTFLKNKTLQLLVPTVVISTLTIIINAFISTNDIGVTAYLEAIGGMWFLRTLFAYFLFVYVLKRLPFDDCWLCLGSVFLAVIFPHGYFLQFNWLLVFFWLGYFLRKYFSVYERNRKLITVSSILIYLFFGRHLEPILITWQSLQDSPVDILWQLLTALAASLAVIGLSYYFCRLPYKKLLQSMGRCGCYTLGIYGIQTLVLEKIVTPYIHLNLTMLPFWLGDFIVTPLLGILATVVCYWLVLWLKRYRIANILLFGGQYK